MSDYLSGRTDRVVMEWEAESFREFEEIASVAEEAHPQDVQRFREWFAKLTELIEHAEVETWRVH